LFHSASSATRERLSFSIISFASRATLSRHGIDDLWHQRTMPADHLGWKYGTWNLANVLGLDVEAGAQKWSLQTSMEKKINSRKHPRPDQTPQKPTKRISGRSLVHLLSEAGYSPSKDNSSDGALDSSPSAIGYRRPTASDLSSLLSPSSSFGERLMIASDPTSPGIASTSSGLLSRSNPAVCQVCFDTLGAANRLPRQLTSACQHDKDFMSPMCRAVHHGADFTPNLGYHQMSWSRLSCTARLQ